MSDYPERVGMDTVHKLLSAAVLRERRTAKTAFMALWRNRETKSMAWMMSFPAWIHPMFDEDKVTGTLSIEQARDIFDDCGLDLPEENVP